MMERKSLKISIFAFALIVLILGGVTKATTLGTADMQHIGYRAYEVVSAWLDGENTFPHAGFYAFAKISGTGQGDYWPDGTPYGRVTGFCVELTQPNIMEVVQYDVIMPQEGPLPSSPMGLAKSKYVQELWGRYYDSNWTLGYDDHEAAAFAVALWEIVYEELPGSPLDWDVETGRFYVEDDYFLANQWLHSLDGTGPKANLRLFSNGDYQDYVAAIPEPTTIILLGMGALTSLLRRKRTCL